MAAEKAGKKKGGKGGKETPKPAAPPSPKKGKRGAGEAGADGAPNKVNTKIKTRQEMDFVEPIVISEWAAFDFNTTFEIFDDKLLLNLLI